MYSLLGSQCHDTLLVLVHFLLLVHFFMNVSFFVNTPSPQPCMEREGIEPPPRDSSGHRSTPELPFRLFDRGGGS